MFCKMGSGAGSFPGISDGKESAFRAGDPGSIPGLGRSSREEHDNPFQYSCLENPIDRGAGRLQFHGVAQSWTWLRLSLSLFTDLRCLAFFLFLLLLLILGNILTYPAILNSTKGILSAFEPQLLRERVVSFREEPVAINFQWSSQEKDKPHRKEIWRPPRGPQLSSC